MDWTNAEHGFDTGHTEHKRGQKRKIFYSFAKLNTTNTSQYFEHFTCIAKVWQMKGVGGLGCRFHISQFTLAWYHISLYDSCRAGDCRRRVTAVEPEGVGLRLGVVHKSQSAGRLHSCSSHTPPRIDPSSGALFSKREKNKKMRKNLKNLKHTTILKERKRKNKIEEKI